MGVAAISSNRSRIILSVLVISLLLMSVPQSFFGSQTGTPTTNNPGCLDDLQLGLSPPDDPAGPPRPLNESAIGFDAAGSTGRTVSLPNSLGSLPINLGYMWTGTKIYTSVLNLRDERNYVRNGTFDTGINTPHATNYSQPWFTSRYPGTGDARLDTGNWASNGSKYVNASMPWKPLHTGIGAGYARLYYVGEYDAWNETFTVSRGTVLAANLSLAYHPNFDVLHAYGSLIVYVKVNSHLVFYRTFADINSAGDRNKWKVSTNINILYDVNGSLVFNTPATTKQNISVGVAYTGRIDVYFDYSTPDPISQNGCWFDNVSLALRAYAKPDQIQLKIKDPDSGLSSNIVTLGWGSGSGTLGGLHIGPYQADQTTYNFDFLSNVSYPASGSFRANATIYTFRTLNLSTTFENQGTKVDWHIPVVTYFQLNGQGIGTTFYSKYYFNASAPSNWAYTNCIDPGGTPHSIPSTNFDQFIVGSVKVLRVNVTAVGIYSSGSNSYAPYQINAQSDNYVKQVFAQKYTGGSWQNATTFKPNDYMRVVGFIASPGGVGANSGTANMSSWYGTPATTWKPLNSTTPTNGFANFTFPLTNALAHAANYSVVVSWLDQAPGQTQAGAGSTTFQLIRDSQLKAYVPPQLTRIAQGEWFTVSVEVVDQINQTALQGALAQYRVAWKGSPQTLAWNSLGQNYTSQPQEQMPTTAHGLYWVNITVTKPYYSSLSVNVSVYAILATQAAPQNQLQTIYWGTSWYNFSINYYGVNPPNNTAVSGASVSCQTIDWQNRTYVSESLAGRYDISIYSTNVAEGTYPIGLLISKLGSDWQPQNFYITLIISPIPTSALGSFIPTDQGDLVADSVTVSSGDTAFMLFSYTDTIGGGIAGASLIYTADFGSGSLSEVAGRPGYYMLNVSTGSLAARSYGIAVSAQKVHYATQTKSVTVSITTPGLPVWLLVGGSLGSAGMVVIVFISYWYIRRARIPFIIKKIDESLKLIGKGDHEAAKPVALRSREELVVGITQERIDIFGKRPVGPEAAESAEEVAAAAGTHETAALKKELEAVEPKEKSGEVIEEVEMDTLDEELQKLEKSEDKEKLPDGAKEVRDVIEKYKQGKKKKS